MIHIQLKQDVLKDHVIKDFIEDSLDWPCNGWCKTALEQADGHICNLLYNCVVSMINFPFLQTKLN